MAGLGDLLTPNSTTEQLILWGVVNQLIQPLLVPVLRAIEQSVNEIDPNEPLTPAALAGMVVRGHLDQARAAEIAKKSGVQGEDFGLLVASYGNPPGPQALAEALRRQIIPEGRPGDDSPSYEGGIAQGDLQNKWSDVIKQLDLGLPGPSSVITAYIRSMLSESEARRLYTLYGGDPSGFDLEANITGEGPTPVEAGILLNRRIIPEKGTGPDAVSFNQAVAESRFKNKWADAYAALRFYRPPPRTITAMFREGSIDETLATQYLSDYGVPAEAIPLYLTKAQRSGVQKAHDITEGEIIKLYTERGLDAPTTITLLKSIGYSQADAELIVAAADLDWERKLTDATIAAVKAAYLHLHIDRNGVVAQLDRVGVSANYRDALISLWDIEVQTGVKQLTVKQVLDMWGVGLLSEQQAQYKLQQIGYNSEDAGLLVALNAPGINVSPAAAAQFSNPGA